MEEASVPSDSLAGIAKRFLRRLLAVGENRLNLLVVEMQEERERLMRMVLFAVGAAAFALLAGIAWTAAVVVFFWQTSPVIVLLILGAIYAVAAVLLCKRLTLLRRQHQVLPATLDQLQKDRARLEGGGP